LGDSAVTEVGGKVGIGTTTPGGQLHVFGASNLDVFAGMGPDVINGPGFNYGYAGNSFGVGAGFFNVRPATGATGVNPSLRFMTVDTERMIVTNAGNVGIGTSAPAQKLDVVGSVALSGNLALPATTSAVGIITLGGSRFVHNFGTNNTFLGANAGNLTMTGDGNTAIGDSTLNSNTTGRGNTASGFSALNKNTASIYNTASGFSALTNNIADGNTASGAAALQKNTTGSFNTAIGFQALGNNTTGGTNIAIGSVAGLNLTTGDNNIDIGDYGVAGETHTTRIGLAGAGARTFIAGISGVTTALAAVPVLIDPAGQLGTVSSSRRYKFDIGDMGEATNALMRLRPVTFRYLAHGENAPLQFGLIAEEVAEVYPELVARNKDGQVETVMYQFLAPMLLNEVQKEQKSIAELREENAAMRDQFGAEKAVLRDQLQRLMQRVEQLEVKRSATQ
jgi:hypothetical protein